MMRRIALVAAFALALAGPAVGQALAIGSGATVALGSGRISLGCGDLAIGVGGTLALDQGEFDGIAAVTVGGLLDGGAGTLRLAGDWANSGSFTPGTSSVSIADGCALPSSALVGDSAFWNFEASSATGRTLSFAAGSTQEVANALSLAGTPGNLLRIRSSSPGTPAFLRLAAAGTQAIAYVDVADNHAALPGQQLAPGAPADFDSVDSGGNDRWFLDSILEVPTLSGSMLLLLGFALAFAAVRRLTA